MKSLESAKWVLAVRKVLTVCAVVFALTLAMPTVSVAGPKGCNMQGSWMGFGGVAGQWTSSIHGKSASSGTLGIQAPEFDPTLDNNFPDVVTITTLRGVWERLTGNTFAYTVVGFGLDADGEVVWIGKNSGYEVLTEDCNLMTVNSTLEVFMPGDDPFSDPPYFAVSLGEIYANRMRVDPPADVD